MCALESKSTLKAQGLCNWQDFVSALHEQCTAYSFLARSVLLMSASNAPASQLARLAVAWKVKLSAILRARLDGEAKLDDHQTYRSMFHLLITELFARNTAGAAIPCQNALVAAEEVQRDASARSSLSVQGHL